mmetsp:Transcript_144511/g.448719  ORF Transcript_144511/g.448719 Transcript_144511/m.448719 type:complete len:132 (+) Transcript_144511:348-743(+)
MAITLYALHAQAQFVLVVACLSTPAVAFSFTKHPSQLIVARECAPFRELPRKAGKSEVVVEGRDAAVPAVESSLLDALETGGLVGTTAGTDATLQICARTEDGVTCAPLPTLEASVDTQSASTSVSTLVKV